MPTDLLCATEIALDDLLSPPGQTTHARFGIACSLGALLGTAAYISPEQARGKPVDKRAEISAFCASSVKRCYSRSRIA